MVFSISSFPSLTNHYLLKQLLLYRYVIQCKVNKKQKHIPPVFRPFVFPVYLRYRLSYKKIYLHLFTSLSEELLYEKKIIFKMADFFQ